MLTVSRLPEIMDGTDLGERPPVDIMGLGNVSLMAPEERRGFGPVGIIWSLLATASAAASAYHGYKRNDSVGWAIGWFVLGSLFPVVTPVVAIAQGFAKPKKR